MQSKYPIYIISKGRADSRLTVKSMEEIGSMYRIVIEESEYDDYAAVIPKWTAAMISGEGVIINGDGETSRDFCFIDNVIQANILSAIAADESKNEVYNIAFGGRTSLNQLFEFIKVSLINNGVTEIRDPKLMDFRPGDVRHSQANIDKAKTLLGYQPKYKISEGMDEAMDWYVRNLSV